MCKLMKSSLQIISVAWPSLALTPSQHLVTDSNFAKGLSGANKIKKTQNIFTSWLKLLVEHIYMKYVINSKVASKKLKVVE